MIFCLSPQQFSIFFYSHSLVTLLDEDSVIFRLGKFCRKFIYSEIQSGVGLLNLANARIPVFNMKVQIKYSCGKNQND